MDAKRPPRTRAAARARKYVRKWAQVLWKLGPHEPKLYLLYAGCLTLWVACLFYSSMRYQTLQSELWAAPQGFDRIVQGGKNGSWSAPLDDVFIHFDFARSAARGYPLQWSEGNGYSSGGTSLLYPFVLALGYYIGFRGLDLMIWAALVACVTVLATLLAARRLYQELPPWAPYLAPLALLGVGALGWTLFSGMEVALFLALWGAALVAWDDLRRAAQSGQVSRAQGLVLGGACALMVATRPEAAPVVALLGITAAYFTYRALGTRRQGTRAALWTLFLSGAPAATVLVAQSVVNRLLTGDSTAAGALVKLELHHPHMTAAQVWESWVFHLKYQILRVTQYHFSELPWLGWIPWVFAALGLAFRSTRRASALLWASAFLWVATVSLNGQVRWQNERYSMPATAWLLLASSLGFAALLTYAFQSRRRSRLLPLAGGALAVGLAALFAIYQAPRFRDQVWFFGRASRNIFDQQVTAGWVLRGLQPTPRRILLGDAGAIPFTSDLPALDLIGLGGYQGLPFARATRLGVGAGIELIKQMPAAARPDYLALYPSWWGLLPMWFGQRLAEVPVRGNVICGGASKVLYRADWTPLDHSSEPFAAAPGERLVDSVDLAHLLSEKAHRLTFQPPEAGYVAMKLLGDPRAPRQGLYDAGRTVTPGGELEFELAGFTPGAQARLLFRVAPSLTTVFNVHLDGQALERVVLEAQDAWQEHAVVVPAHRVSPTLHWRIAPESGEVVIYHVFALQGPAAPASPAP